MLQFHDLWIPKSCFKTGRADKLLSCCILHTVINVANKCMECLSRKITKLKSHALRFMYRLSQHNTHIYTRNFNQVKNSTSLKLEKLICRSSRLFRLRMRFLHSLNEHYVYRSGCSKRAMDDRFARFRSL